MFEEYGAEYVGIRHTKKHPRIIFKDSEGVYWEHTFSETPRCGWPQGALRIKGDLSRHFRGMPYAKTVKLSGRPNL